MGKYNCYQFGREIKLFKLDLGQGDMFYFHDKCLDKNIKEINLKGEEIEKP